jgi:hypothetical protein
MEHSEISNFSTVQREALRVIRKVYQSYQSKLWRPLYWEHLFVRFVAFCSITGVIGFLFIRTWGLAPNALETAFNFTYAPGNIGNVFFALLILIAYVLLTAPWAWFIPKLPRFMSNTFKILYYSFMIPGGAIAISILSMVLLGILRVVWGSSITLLIFTLLADMLLLMVITLYIYVETQLPYWVFMLLDKPIEIEKKAYMPTYEGLVNEVIPLLESHILSWDLDMLNSVKALAHQKHANIAAQSQTFSPLISTFSLFSLFALIFSQQDLRLLLTNLETRMGSEFAGLSIFVFVVAIAAIFFFSTRYFVRIFISLRVLEIISILVERRISSILQAPPAIKGFNYANGLYIPVNSPKKN